MQNQRNDGYYILITTHSGETTIEPLMPIVDVSRNDIVDIDEAPKVESENLVTTMESSQKSTGFDCRSYGEKVGGHII